MQQRALAGPGDRALWARAVMHQDSHAFSTLVRRHHGAVRGFLRRLCAGDDACADDIAQDVFLRAHRSLSSWRGEGSLQGWLMTIAWRGFLSHKRSKRFLVEILDGEAGVEAPVPGGLEHTARDTERDVIRAMASLRIEERAALTLCFQEELTHEEAAAALGMPIGTLKSHVARGKEKLKQRLQSYAPRERVA